MQKPSQPSQPSQLEPPPKPAEPAKSEPAQPVAEAKAEEPSQPAPEAPKKPAAGGSLASRIKSRMAVRKPHGGSDSIAPVRRDSTVASSGKMRSLDRPSGGGGEKKSSETGKSKRREPRINVKMASLPEVAEPSPGKSSGSEPKAQKPDVKLSPDVIAGHRQGMRAPLEELAKEDSEKKRAGPPSEVV